MGGNSHELLTSNPNVLSTLAAIHLLAWIVKPKILNVRIFNSFGKTYSGHGQRVGRTQIAAVPDYAARRRGTILGTLSDTAISPSVCPSHSRSFCRNG